MQGNGPFLTAKGEPRMVDHAWSQSHGRALHASRLVRVARAASLLCRKKISGIFDQARVRLVPIVCVRIPSMASDARQRVGCVHVGLLVVAGDASARVLAGHRGFLLRRSPPPAWERGGGGLGFFFFEGRHKRGRLPRGGVAGPNGGKPARQPAQSQCGNHRPEPERTHPQQGAHGSTPNVMAHDSVMYFCLALRSEASFSAVGAEVSPHPFLATMRPLPGEKTAPYRDRS